MAGNYRRGALFTALLLAAALLLGSPAGAARDEDEFSDFSELELGDLLDVTVTSAAKMKQSIMDSPNSITVIGAEDIRRSGYREVPEALRLAPGVYVARLSGNRWSVTIGGFAHGKWTNNLLLLIDGVSVYSGNDGGVIWEDLPVTIDEIERIEVIRGPGGVLYGANAVNGVINIVTWGADGESPSYVKSRVGTQGVRSGTAGARLSSEDGRVSSRLAISYDENAGFGEKNGDKLYGDYESYSVSSRNRVEITDTMSITLAGHYRGSGLRYEEYVTTPNVRRRSEQSVLRVKIEQHFDNGAQWHVQGYSWRMVRDTERMRGGRMEFGRDLEHVVDDLEAQVLLPFDAMGKHNLILGGGHRWLYHVDQENVEREKKYRVSNAYVHDEWTLSEQLKLNYGVKWEEISLISPTWQWRSSLIYQPVPEHSFRLGAANAYRAPFLAELYYAANLGDLPAVPGVLPPAGWTDPWAVIIVRGNDELDPEQVLSYEFGYRGVFSEKVAVEINYAYREYDDLIAIVKTGPGVFIPALGLPMNVGQKYAWDNQGSAVSHSVDVGVDARLTEEWRLLAHYSHLDMDTDEDTTENRETNVPRNMGRVQLSYSSPAGFLMDASAHYTDELKVVYFLDPTVVREIDDYWRLDLHIAQRFDMENGALTIGAVGQNLGREWREDYANFATETEPFELRRSYYGYVEYNFD